MSNQGSVLPDEQRRCPDCTANMVKIGIDLYRCTSCGETFEATEEEE